MNKSILQKDGINILSILFNFEGPKGSGKSTIINKFLDDYPNISVRKFDSNTIVTNDEFKNASKNDVIFDRGILSYQIYDWLWNNNISKREKLDFSTYSFNIKTPINKEHFDYLIENIKYKLVIFYSSDIELLINRINKRKVEINKGADELEWKTLSDSNLYFKYMGMFLKELYPDKVLLIDVNNNMTINEMYNFIKKDIL